MIPYNELDSIFVLPKRPISPFYVNVKRIPRKLKKKVKKWCGISWSENSNESKLWYYLEYKNNDYKRFLIKQICNEN